MDKKLIHTHVASIYLCDGSLNSLIDELTKLKSTYENELFIEYNDFDMMYIYFNREETDEEYNKRIMEEAQNSKSKRIKKYAKQFISGKQIPPEMVDEVKGYLKKISN